MKLKHCKPFYSYEKQKDSNFFHYDTRLSNYKGQFLKKTTINSSFREDELYFSAKMNFDNYLVFSPKSSEIKVDKINLSCISILS